jgi:hypothetical protein
MVERTLATSVLLGTVILAVTFGRIPESFGQGTKSEETDPILVETRQLAQALLRHDPMGAQVRLQALIDYRRSHFISNMSDVAGVFLFALSKSASGLSADARLSLSQQAIMLAPDFPPLYFNLARAHLANDIWAIGAAFRALADGLKAYTRHLPAFFALMANTSIRLSTAFVLCFAMFSLFVFVRYVRLFAHDVRDVLPARDTALSSALLASTTQNVGGVVLSRFFDLIGFVAIGVLYFLPFLCGLGIVSTLLFSLLLIAPYMKRRELVASVIACVLVMAESPLAIVAEVPRSLSQSRAFLLWQCLHERCSEGDLARLPEDDPMFNIASSLVSIQKSPDNEEVLATAFSKLGLASKDDEISLGIVGNMGILLALLRCQEGKPDKEALQGATSAFDRILQKHPENEGALRGLAVSATLAGDQSRAETMFQRLVQVTRERDLSFLPKIRTVLARQDVCAHHREVVSFLEMPEVETLSVYAKNLSFKELSGLVPKQGFLFGSLMFQALPFVVFIVILILPLINQVSKRRSIARVCPRCGELTCRQCSIIATGFDYCPRCIEEQVRSAFSGSRDIGMASDMRVYSVMVMKRYAGIAMAFVPGAKQVLDGRTATGLFMMFMFAMSATYVMLAQDPYDGVSFAGGGGRELSLLPPIVMVLVFVWSVVDGLVHGEG